MIDFIKTLWPRPFKWLSKLVGSGDPRVHGTVVIMVASSLCLSLLAIVYGLLTWHPLVAELTVVVGAITTLATLIYNRGKKADEAKREVPDGQ